MCLVGGCGSESAESSPVMPTSSSGSSTTASEDTDEATSTGGSSPGTSSSDPTDTGEPQGSGSTATGETGSGDSGGSSSGTSGPAACEPVELGVFTPEDGDVYGFAGGAQTVVAALGSAGMVVLDLSDPSTPTPVGSLDFGPGELVYRVALQSDLAFLGLRGAGWKIVSLADPATPMVIAEGDDETRDIEIVGNTMLLADNNGVIIYDVSDASNPDPLLTDMVLPGSTEMVMARGNTAFVGSVSQGLFALDISSPSEAAMTGHFDTNGNGWIGVAEETAFVSTSDGVHVVDITDPTDLTELGFYARERAEAVAGTPETFYVLGADTASTQVPFFAVVDVADPTTPLEHTTAFDEFSDPLWLDIVGSHVLFSAEDDRSLHIIDPCP